MRYRETVRPTTRSVIRAGAGPALVAGLALALFLPAIGNGFIVFDDDVHVTENPVVRRGLTREGAAWAFTTRLTGNWHPLVWLSHEADVTLFGLDPRGHHLTSVLLHTANAVLVLLLLRAMTGRAGPSLFAALLFAAHPLRVESVAWVAERKDVLSVFLGLLTMAAHHRHARAPGARRYALVVGAFALSVMAKPMMVTVPLLLLLLDWWPLGRWGRGSAGRLAAEKAPLVLMSLGAAALAYAAQRGAGAVGLVGEVPLPARAANALVAAAAYLRKTLLPTDLAVFYPYASHGLPAAKVAAAAATLVFLSAAAAAARRRFPFLTFGWIWYLVALAPVLGLVQVGYQAMADRYTYLPLLGLFVALAWAVGAAPGRARVPAVAGAAAAVAACLVLARGQLAHWRDSETLFAHALAVTEGNWMAHNVVGNAFMERGDAAGAERHYLAAVAASPGYAIGHFNLGNSRLRQGKRAEAIADYRRALRINPTAAGAWNNLGSALLLAGRPGEAASSFERALALDPGNREARANLDLARRRGR